MTGLPSSQTYLKTLAGTIQLGNRCDYQSSGTSAFKIVEFKSQLSQSKKETWLSKKHLKQEEFKLFRYKTYPIRIKINLKPGLRDAQYVEHF